MRRRDVSPEGLARIIRLRQSNTSWLQIQREIGIPRRIAKRAYEEYGRSQSREELKAARKDVAAEEFRNHLGCLVKLAEALVNALDIPAPSREPISAKEVILNRLQLNIVGEYDVYGLPSNLRLRTYRPEACLRQNQILFKSLQTHTCEKVDWQTLNQWENTRNECTETQGKLRQQAGKMLLNILNQKQGLTDRMVKGSGKEKEDLIERMVDGVLHAVWQNILAGKTDESPVLQTVSVGHPMVEVVFGECQLGLGLIFTEANLAKEVADACIWAARNLCIERKEDTVEPLVNHVHRMRKAIDQLAEMLNPLMLRPMILHTRCDLCPA